MSILTRTHVLLAVALLTGGCAGSLEGARREGVAARKVGSARAQAAPDRCASLDSTHRWWGGTAQGAAFAAGGSGLSTIATDDARLQTGLAIGAAAAGVLGAFAAYVSSDAAESHARECSAP